MPNSLSLEPGSGTFFGNRVSADGINGLPWWPSGKESTCQCRRQVQSLGQEDPLEKGKATASTVRAWRIPWTEEPRGLLSVWAQETDKRLSD